MKHIHLFNEAARINHHAVADYAKLAFMQRTCGNQMQRILHAVYNDGMAGVVSALIADNHIGLAGQIVNKTSFTLVSPLCTKN